MLQQHFPCLCERRGYNIDKVNAIASGGGKNPQQQPPLSPQENPKQQEENTPQNREKEDGLRRNVWLQKAS